MSGRYKLEISKEPGGLLVGVIRFVDDSGEETAVGEVGPASMKRQLIGEAEEIAQRHHEEPEIVWLEIGE